MEAYPYKKTNSIQIVQRSPDFLWRSVYPAFEGDHKKNLYKKTIVILIENSYYHFRINLNKWRLGILVTFPSLLGGMDRNISLKTSMKKDVFVSQFVSFLLL